jgi:transposase-like protein
MEHPARDFHDELRYRNEKARPSCERRAFVLLLKVYQPRVRERIMKLSKVYSATCHHRYSSDR